MSEMDKIMPLIAYLHALANVNEKSDVKVFTEIKRTVQKLEELLNN